MSSTLTRIVSSRRPERTRVSRWTPVTRQEDPRRTKCYRNECTNRQPWPSIDLTLSTDSVLRGRAVRSKYRQSPKGPRRNPFRDSVFVKTSERKCLLSVNDYGVISFFSVSRFGSKFPNSLFENYPLRWCGVTFPHTYFHTLLKPQ